MKKIVTIIGARPQIIKSAAISRAISSRFSEELEEIIVHTGQHYDENMSSVFFDEMNIPKPNYNLNVGSKSHAVQTAEMIIGIEEILLKEKPDALVVYGDTNSTLAGSTVASKLHVPIVHVEAGLRSFNKLMPEEVNRICCDHVSTLLFSPTKIGYDNLVQEGFKINNSAPYSSDNPQIYHCGDVMYDNSSFFTELAKEKSTIIQELELENQSFILSTIHRNNNTDDPKRLESIFKALLDISNKEQKVIVLPLHPRTKKLLASNLPPELLDNVQNSNLIRIIEPVSFFNIIALELNSDFIITDSGGLQKEAYFFNKPCVILRSETEWMEIVDAGKAIIADADYDRIVKAYDDLKELKSDYPLLYGDGKAAEFICSEIIQNLA